MLDRADMEHLHHHQKFFWTVWVSTSVSQIRRAQDSPGIHRVKCRFRLRRSALETETLHFYLPPAMDHTVSSEGLELACPVQ